jgi:hypothetical protein
MKNYDTKLTQKFKTLISSPGQDLYLLTIVFENKAALGQA